MSGQRQYKGAYVKTPEAGIHKNISVLDFKSLYPSIILAHNISPETLNCAHRECRQNKVPEFNRHFCLKKKGKVPENLEKILKEREKIKRLIKKLGKKEKHKIKSSGTENNASSAKGIVYPQKDNASDEKNKNSELKELIKREQDLKLAASITYGMFGYRESKTYNIKCAESVTAFGRTYIKQSIKRAENSRFRIIYSDTDSIFLTGKSKDIKSILKKLNKNFKKPIKLEYRGFYKRGLFTTAKSGIASKKKYALIDRKNNLTIKGFEAVRGDWCQLARVTQREILKLILTRRKKQAVNLVKESIEKIKTGHVSLSQLIISTQISRPLKDYVVIGPHIKIAKTLESEGTKINPGDKISYIITRRPGSITEKAERPENVSIKDVDKTYYIANQIVPSSMRVLTIANVKEEGILGTTLKKFKKISNTRKMSKKIV